MIDSYVPKGEAVLAFLGVPDAYTAHEILVSYQAASNETTADILNVGWVEGYQPRLLDTFTFSRADAAPPARYRYGGGFNPAMERSRAALLRSWSRAAAASGVAFACVAESVGGADGLR